MEVKINPKNLLQFSPEDRIKAEETFRSSWSDFRNELASNKFTYDQTEEALKVVFLKQFDKLFQFCGKQYLVVLLKDVFSNNTIGRGAVLKSTEPITYNRFIPNSAYIKNDNRFSPPGVEWLYLAIGDTDDHIKRCSEAECRVKSGNRFGFCHFKMAPDYDSIKIVDLTTFYDKTYDEINMSFNHSIGLVYQDSLSDIKPILDAITNRTPLNNPKSIIDKTLLKAKDKFETYINLWRMATHSKMLCEQIFVPIEDCEKKIEYAPFQTMAKYFEKQGFDGIIYKSTVYPYAKNLVLFNKNSAVPFGTVDDYIIE